MKDTAGGFNQQRSGRVEEMLHKCVPVFDETTIRW